MDTRRDRWWALLAAIAFLYSVAMLWSLTQSQAELRATAEAHAIADSQRRGALLADFAAERLSAATELAETPEIGHYFANRALGMSLKYGLGSNLDAIESAFRARMDKQNARGASAYHRFAFRDTDGHAVVDLAPPGALPLPGGRAASPAPALAIDTAARRFVATAPVKYKDRIAGEVVMIGGLDTLSRFLIDPDNNVHYRELLVADDGTRLLAPPGPPLSADDLVRLAGLPENSVVPFRSKAGDDQIAIRTAARGMPLSVVTLFDHAQFYGPPSSRALLLAAWIMPVALALGTALYFRMRRRTVRLQSRAEASDRRSLELTGLNASLSDEIRRREEVEQALRLQQQELERMTEKLQQSMQRAEDANRAKSQFLAHMSHEIRTPLNAVLGLAQLLQMPEQSEAERRLYSETIFNSGQTLLGILNDILDLSKIESGRMELSDAPLDVLRALRHTRHLFSESAAAAGLTLEVEWSGPAGPSYRGDALRLQQVLGNLVGNAVKFTRQGGIRVLGREVSRAESGAVLEFTVADTGIGIDEDKQALLFQPFTQVDGSATRKFGGTGLGLSIVRSIVAMMGGSVTLESAPGRGTTIRFDIRVRLDAGKPAPAGAAAERQPGSAPGAGASARILIVEDTPANVLVIGGFLKRLGFAFESAGNGRQALEALARGGGFQLILMDCHMPVMDGFEATRAIRSSERQTGLAPVPIVALTAGAYQEDREICLAAGMNDYVAKPIRFEQLREMIGKWCPAAVART